MPLREHDQHKLKSYAALLLAFRRIVSAKPLLAKSSIQPRVDHGERFRMFGVIDQIHELFRVGIHVVQLSRPVVVAHVVPVLDPIGIPLVERECSFLDRRGRIFQNRNQAIPLNGIRNGEPDKLAKRRIDVDQLDN